MTSADCSGTEVCVDGECQERSAMDGGAADAGGGCPSMVLCGSPAMCCAEGDECVEGACLAPCASGVRCGADRATCCGDSQVCISDACVDPGDACTDSFDCPMGAFCEPTLGRCLPQFDPVTCERTPVFGMFETTLEWSQETATEVPDCMHPISTPVVVDLDGDGLPEVVSSASCNDSWQRAVLRAFRGDTGAPVWTVSDPLFQINGRASIGAGDLTGDGLPEIVALAVPAVARAYAFRPDGTFLWASTDATGGPLTIAFDNGAPTFADLDMDGTPEVILGAVVLDASGRLVWQQDTGGAEGSNSGYEGGISAVADIDLDGAPEVVAGRRAYEADGTPKWTAPVLDGYPAIASFDADPQPEVVLVASGQVYLLDGMDGSVQWGPVALPGGGRGGPPTVADFDGDGLAEIGVAGAASYSVYDPHGPMDVLWSQPTQDLSSNATGSSVFDFEGDGAAEVVYADECYMRVYRGTDGMVLLQIPSVSATIHEYPLVADVDGDGNSEIVITANDRTSGQRTQCLSADPTWDGARRGVFVYGDARDQWVRTRRIWNQHAYHVTNIEPDGVVPASETDNWSVPGLNNYRQNAQGEGVYNAPDLAVLALEVRLASCPEAATLRARVVNEGSLGVMAGVPVAFYRGTTADPAAFLGTASTTVPLLPGATTVVELSVPLSGPSPWSFLAVVDDDGAGGSVVDECDESDNAATIEGLSCVF